jgi:hypothetical protein
LRYRLYYAAEIRRHAVIIAFIRRRPRLPTPSATTGQPHYVITSQLSYFFAITPYRAAGFRRLSLMTLPIAQQAETRILLPLPLWHAASEEDRAPTLRSTYLLHYSHFRQYFFAIRRHLHSPPTEIGISQPFAFILIPSAGIERLPREVTPYSRRLRQVATLSHEHVTVATPFLPPSLFTGGRLPFSFLPYQVRR